MQNSEEKITWQEHIKQRPAMYVGTLGITGFKQLLESFLEELLTDNLDNPIFEIEFYPDNKLKFILSDIDLKSLFLRIEQLGDNNIFGSLGLAVLLALNSSISISLSSLPSAAILSGKKGVYETNLPSTITKGSSIIIDYTIDKDVFKDFIINYEHTNDFLRQFAFLNSSLKIISIDKTSDELQRNIFQYPTGIFSQLDLLISREPHGKPTLRLNVVKQTPNFIYKFSFCYTSVWTTSEACIIKSFAGNTETYLGGSLVNGVFDGIKAAIQQLAKKQNTAIFISKKMLREDLVLVASIKGEVYSFFGSTKCKLDMPEVQKEVKQIIFDELLIYFQLNPAIAETILNKYKRWEY